MKKVFMPVMLAMQLLSCTGGNSQESSTQIKVGGRCEGCEAIYETPVPFEQLQHTDTLPGFNEASEKLVISGIVYQKDGGTPAKNVVIYFYHTDEAGVYPARGGEKGWERRHGYLRGWVRTNEKGEYRFYTRRPASYPNSNNPQHIHMTVKEPGKTEYWIDDIHFLDDPLVTASMRQSERNVGGSGLVQLKKQNGIYTGMRNIILGMNVQDYP